jgi:hypothetical protein
MGAPGTAQPRPQSLPYRLPIAPARHRRQESIAIGQRCGNSGMTGR